MNTIQIIMQHKKAKIIFLTGIFSFAASSLLQMLNRCPLFDLENRILDFLQGLTLGVAMPTLLASLVFVVISRNRCEGKDTA